ncbi:MAG: phosphocholine cytidylyltransferase family protein [Bacteroidia bacterium]|nr:phosphocholine cytidylyltransferase family protein [Bacteroidia bacterium]
MTKALILAAGVASRLRPLTDETPKCLLDIGGKCILERMIDNLTGNGVTSFVIVTGYLDHLIRDFVTRRFPDINVEFVHNPVYDSTNNIYSLWLARDAMRGHAMLLLDSDILFAPEIVGALLAAPQDNCLALRRGPVGDEEIKVLLGPDERVREISKTVPVGDAAGESIGIERFSPSWVRAMYALLERMITHEGRSGIFYEAAFEEMIEQGHVVYAVDVSAWPCMELDTVDDVLHARTVLAPLLHD